MATEHKGHTVKVDGVLLPEWFLEGTQQNRLVKVARRLDGVVKIVPAKVTIEETTE